MLRFKGSKAQRLKDSKVQSIINNKTRQVKNLPGLFILGKNLKI
jgi:hypothetical protein